MIFCSALDNFVIYISDISDYVYLKAAPAQVTNNDINCSISTRMAKMTEIIYGNTADININFARDYWLELFFSSCQRILYLQHDSPLLRDFRNLECLAQPMLHFFLAEYLSNIYHFRAIDPAS